MEMMLCSTAFLDFLRQVAASEDPVQLLYNSNLTARIVQEFQANGRSTYRICICDYCISGSGGILSLSDFSDYRSIVRDDSEVIYSQLRGGTRIACGPPPPSSAAVTQAVLAILDGCH